MIQCLIAVEKTQIALQMPLMHISLIMNLYVLANHKYVLGSDYLCI
jgi:hypothetical protein